MDRCDKKTRPAGNRRAEIILRFTSVSKHYLAAYIPRRPINAEASGFGVGGIGTASAAPAAPQPQAGSAPQAGAASHPPLSQPQESHLLQRLLQHRSFLQQRLLQHRVFLQQRSLQQRLFLQPRSQPQDFAASQPQAGAASQPFESQPESQPQDFSTFLQQPRQQ